jgi:two-component system response regulator AlgR
MTETRLRTLIVDDEPLAIERLQIMCSQIPTLNLVGTATDGAAALRMVPALLDIAMPGLDGMEVARALAQVEPRPMVIFVTAFDQFAVAAFDVSAVDYLLKPVAQDRLERAVARASTQNASPPPPAPENPLGGRWAQEFWVPHRAEIIRIAAAEIDLIEAERDYMRLHVGTRSYLLHQTITELERRLDPAEFVRLHRSTIARRGHITGFRHEAGGAWLAQLKDGKELRIGRTYLANARAIAGR